MTMLVPASVFAVSTLAVAMAAAPLPPHPIELVASTGSTGIELKMIGRAATDQIARYTLEVVASGGNSSSQSGTARLKAGQEAVLATVRLGSTSAGTWRATLKVEPENGDTYVLRYPD